MIGYTFADKILKEPHVIIGGMNGSGKSNLLSCLLYTAVAHDPQALQLYMIDLKRVELQQWKDFPHVKQIIKDPEEVNNFLDRMISVMYSRYQYMEKHNQTMSTHSDIYIVIDELAQVLTVKGTVDRIDELMRLARAARIHLILATQQVNRSSGIPGRIYTNTNCRIGLHCASAIESRMIIGKNGCETLPRYGQCYIFNAEGYALQEIPYISTIDILNQLLEYTISA